MASSMMIYPVCSIRLGMRSLANVTVNKL